MADLIKGFNYIAWNGANLTLQGCPFVDKLIAVYDINSTGGGHISFVPPGNAFSAVKTLVKGKLYEMRTNAAFTLPDALVTLANQLPTVALSLSANTAQPDGSVTLTAAANDPDGTIAKVEYFNGTSKIGESFSGPTFAYVYGGLVTGSYTLTARATDNQGAVTTSLPKQLTVAPPAPYTYTATYQA